MVLYKIMDRIVFMSEIPGFRGLPASWLFGSKLEDFSDEARFDETSTRQMGID